jgi:hypothetical protein
MTVVHQFWADHCTTHQGRNYAAVIDMVGEESLNSGVEEVMAIAMLAAAKHVAVRRKWTEETDVMLLKEIAARRAHLPKFGKAMEGYAAISVALEGQLPWKTDAKHSRDRFTLVCRTWSKDDVRGRIATGVEEILTERDTLLAGLIEEAASWKDRRVEERGTEAEKQEVHLNAVKEALSLALNCGGGGYQQLANNDEDAGDADQEPAVDIAGTASSENIGDT